jgi:hypothetical protein
LGERYILMRLFRRDKLPQLFGSDQFTKATLRFAWHLTTVAWLGFAAILISISDSANLSRSFVLNVIAAVAVLSGLLAAGFSKGKHLSWLVFFAIAVLLLYSI